MLPVFITELQLHHLQSRQRAPSWEETLTITSSGNIKRPTVKLVQLDSPLMQAALRMESKSQSSGSAEASALSGAGDSLITFASFVVDCDRPARATVLFGVTRRTLTLTGVTTAVACHAATPSVLLAAGLGQRIDPAAIAAALSSAPAHQSRHGLRLDRKSVV